MGYNLNHISLFCLHVKTCVCIHSRMCVQLWLCAPVYASALRGKNRVSVTEMLELQAVLSHPTCVVGNKLWSSKRQKVILPTQPSLLIIFNYSCVTSCVFYMSVFYDCMAHMHLICIFILDIWVLRIQLNFPIFSSVVY